jgi:hypothetical protein
MTGETCTAGVCVGAASCTDGIEDGAETDVDCGGNACAPCAVGKKCLVDSDCLTSVCSLAGVCTP